MDKDRIRSGEYAVVVGDDVVTYRHGEAEALERALAVGGHVVRPDGEIVKPKRARKPKATE